MFRRLNVCTIMLLLGGCAATTDMTLRYLADSPVTAVRTMLLVGRTPEFDDRERWENACAKELRQRKLTLITSNTSLPLWHEAGNDHLLTWARENQVDAVLIAELTGLLLAPVQIPPQNFMQSERAIGEGSISPSTWDFSISRNSIDRKEKPTSAPSEIHEVEFQLISPSGKTLWNGIGLTHEANDLEAIAKSQCRALKRNLKNHQLLP